MNVHKAETSDVTRRRVALQIQPPFLNYGLAHSLTSSRSIPSKQFLVLGQPSSVQINSCITLLHKALSGDQKNAQRIDFAIGYDFADVGDEADEGKYSCLQATSNSMLRVH